MIRQTYPVLILLEFLFLVFHGVSSYGLYGGMDISKIEIFPKNINFTVFVTNNEGVIFFCTNRVKHFIEIVLIHERNGTRSLNFNYCKYKRSKSVQDFCGLSKNGSLVLTFLIRRKSNKILISCNKLSELPLYNNPADAEKGHDSSKPIDVYIGNARHTSESFSAQNNQLYGCLKNFQYDGKIITFKESGTNFRSACNDSCIQKVCNDPACVEMYKITKSCNCSLSLRKPKVCNKFIGEDSPYDAYNNTKFTFLKFSWTNQFRNFVILELRTRNETIQISVYKSNSINLRRNSDEERFLKCEYRNNNITELFINVSSDSYNLKCNEMRTEKKFSFSQRIHQLINTGFMEDGDRREYCDCYISLVLNDSESHTNWELRVSKSLFTMKFYTEAILLFIVIPTIGTLVTIVFAMVLLIRNCRQRNNKVQKLSNATTIALETTVKVQGEEDDTYDYDYSHIYDEFTNESIETIICGPEEDEYMPMSPTLPPRQNLPPLENTLYV